MSDPADAALIARFAAAHERIERARKRAPRMKTLELVGAIVAAERFMSDDAPTVCPSFALAAAAAEELERRGVKFTSIYTGVARDEKQIRGESHGKR